MEMELYQIRNFLQSLRTSSFTKAAIRSRPVSQPALSASVAKLEEELGVKLFHRTSKSRQAYALPGYASKSNLHSRFLDACNKVKAELKAGEPDRALRIGVLRNPPSAHLAKLVETLRRKGWSLLGIELVDRQCDR